MEEDGLQTQHTTDASGQKEERKNRKTIMISKIIKTTSNREGGRRKEEKAKTSSSSLTSSSCSVSMFVCLGAKHQSLRVMIGEKINAISRHVAIESGAETKKQTANKT